MSSRNVQTYVLLVVISAWIALSVAQPSVAAHRCPLPVKKLVENAPDESVLAVKRACKPSNSSTFCESCICTVFVNFVPATLRSAGVLTNSTSLQAAEDTISACAPSSHVALLQLGALTEDWSQALNQQCSEGSETQALQSMCDKYAPKILPIKNATAPSSAKGSSVCPFQAEDIKQQELLAAKAACGVEATLLLSSGTNSTSSGFCRACMCSIQSSINGIIKQREHLLNKTTPTGPAGDDEYRGCYIVLTHALVEGGVLTSEAAGVLGSEECRPLAQLTPAARKAACSAESGPKSGVDSAGSENKTVVEKAVPTSQQKSPADQAQPALVLSWAASLLLLLAAAVL